MGSGSMVWWISLVAFHTRNRPPASRIRSRQENARSTTGWPSAPGGIANGRTITGWVRLTMNASIDSSASRSTSARPMPMRRACTRRSGASLLERIETNTRLSTPSTTSMTINVNSATHASGLTSSAAIPLIDDVLLPVGCDRGRRAGGRGLLAYRPGGARARRKTVQSPEIRAPGGQGARIANL